VLSVTVIAPTVLEAETAAKTILILGREKGLQWLGAYPCFSALVILENGQQFFGNSFEDYIWR
jgi:thiamine biosynthesis lipoprotein ApbE